MPQAIPTTRLAPSPTGALHLGNARTFLVNWALARRRGWRIILRIEDLDSPRVKPQTIADTIDTLRWLGVDWDQGPIIQSHNLAPYRDAMAALVRASATYPAPHTRSQLEDASLSAPQEGQHEAVFPASLRPPQPWPDFSADSAGENWRFATPPDEISFTDEFAGPQCFTPAQAVGDFLIWTKRAAPAYQLAVVVDDARQGVTHIVRGDDLLDSAARQLMLYRALGLTPEPTYLHLPLVRGQDGRRLAKRHGDTRVLTYREKGVAPERIIGLIARWCGIPAGSKPLSAGEFAAALTLDTIPHSPITFTSKDDAWLLAP